MSKALVSARRPAEGDDLYGWVWVLPLPDGRFRIAAIDVPKHLVDNDECFFEDDFYTRFVTIVDEVDQVDDVLREKGLDPDTLDAPWHNDFPL